jgi:L-threonylcarbamoyladenylate synthase
MIYILPTDTCFWIWCSIHDVKDYLKIYELKKRPLEKPLAIMVESFDFLQKHTFLTKEQENFLKNYKRPFTILLSPKTQFINDALPNKNLYKKIAFRIANMDAQKHLINQIGSFFLTSANLWGEKEIYKKEELPFQESENIQLFVENDLEIVPPSDIFEFISDTTKTVYVRKY